MVEDKAKSVSLKLKIPEEHSRGVYANHVLVQFTPLEFHLCFSCIVPSRDAKSDEASNEVEAGVVSSIIISPELMPEIIRVFEENYRKFKEIAK